MSMAVLIERFWLMGYIVPQALFASAHTATPGSFFHKWKRAFASQHNSQCTWMHALCFEERA